MEKSILIIEDDEFLGTLAGTKFRNEGINITIVNSGEDAVEFLKSEIPSLILLDLMLPNMSGYEVLKSIRSNESTKDLTVLVFSNLGDREDISKAEEAGATEFLVKSSFTLDELVEKVKTHLEE